ncbi:Ubiquitin carboxyl-terminal hydrolase 42 [Thelohanellus kitauei]|uniref:Ubiquitin carboxyl-terminal hydrolase 36 n=1 Tax=Thelohanellus kitauei TaxID=669202 RepID=A0A0C2MC92_THEKT|nr:Ubiquitin carboxyl-terminal hydrolase 42 [Thelohanellus kitauei]
MNSRKSGSVSPHRISSHISEISKELHKGRQEDAHEFLLALLNHSREHFTIPKGLDRYTYCTQFIDHIFGGWTRNTVTFDGCAHKSVSFDPFLVLHLDIEGCRTIYDSLNNFCSDQPIHGGTIECDSCKTKRHGTLRQEIYQPSRFMIFQLQRFKRKSWFISKNDKFVKYFKTLKFPCYTQDDDEEITFHLYGVIVHLGGGCNSGHYFAYAQSQCGLWYRLDDTSVSVVNINEVLEQHAYLLFYRREDINGSSKDDPRHSLTSNVDDANLDKLTTKNPRERFKLDSDTDSSNQRSLSFDDLYGEQFSAMDNKYHLNGSRNITVAKWDTKNNAKIDYNENIPSCLKGSNGVGVSIKSWNGLENHIDRYAHKPDKKLKCWEDFEYESGKKRKNKRRKNGDKSFRPNQFQLVSDLKYNHA